MCLCVVYHLSPYGMRSKRQAIGRPSRRRPVAPSMWRKQRKNSNAHNRAEQQRQQRMNHKKLHNNNATVIFDTTFILFTVAPRRTGMRCTHVFSVSGCSSNTHTHTHTAMAIQMQNY